MRSSTNSHNLQLKKSRSTNRCANACNSTSELLNDVGIPNELIIDILVRLPVKFLMRSKCVAKSWLRLISSPKFIRSHLSRADRHENYQVLVPMSNHIGFKHFTLDSALYEPSVNVSDIESLTDKPDQYAFIVGIVNGLVCLRGVDGFFLRNPVLRTCKFIPAPISSGRGSRQMFYAYGFGYDDANDDYKVVVVLSSRDDESEFMVYSLLTDSWRKIEGFKPGIHVRDFGKYVNGKIHWTVGPPAPGGKIVCLDISSDKYGELQQPGFDAGASAWVLGSSEGKLVVLYDYPREKADLWVMDKYGVEESWTKVVSIPYDDAYVHPALRYLPHYRVVCISRNGEIVMSFLGDLLVYCSKRKEFRKVKFGGDTHYANHVYVESLVSPNGVGYL